jgi:NADH-quinone oxidoreductase subunit C
VTSVEPEQWLTVVSAAYVDGYRYFDWLGCVDEIGRRDTLRVVLVLRDLETPALPTLMLSTEVPRDDPRLDSIGTVFAGAGWHEREAAELFGIEFVGGERRRLLLDPAFSGTPLRKDEVLVARSSTGWPGTKEPGEPVASPGRRRTLPPGVPEPEVWGDRDPNERPADPAEIAASTVGGRVRRRGR